MVSTTPQRRRGPASPSKTRRTPGPCPYKGLEVTVPGEIFDQPGQDEVAIIRGWNNKRTDQLIVKFEDHATYWFPLDDVLKWMGPAAAAAATAAAAAATAAAATAVTPQKPSSPLAASPTPTTVRRRSSRLAAAAAAGADSAAAGPTGAEVLELPVGQQEDTTRQQRLSPGKGRKLHAKGQKLLQEVAGTDGNKARGLLVIGAAILGVLVSIALAWYVAQYPAHHLETFMDRVRKVPEDV